MQLLVAAARAGCPTCRGAGGGRRPEEVDKALKAAEAELERARAAHMQTVTPLKAPQEALHQRLRDARSLPKRNFASRRPSGWLQTPSGPPRHWPALKAWRPGCGARRKRLASRWRTRRSRRRRPRARSAATQPSRRPWPNAGQPRQPALRANWRMPLPRRHAWRSAAADAESKLLEP